MILEDNAYRRIKDTESIGIYFGRDNAFRTSMYVKLSKSYRSNFTGRYLISSCNKRDDGCWAFSVSITDERFHGVFKKLVFDLAESVNLEKNSKIAERMLINRLNDWEELFQKNIAHQIPYEKVIGLAGELYFLKEFMMKKYGVTESINSWGGPTGAVKDFEIKDTWYEVKTKSLKKNTVHISDDNQLVSSREGYLSVVSYEKSSLASSMSVNIVELVDQIKNIIEDPDTTSSFLKKLAEFGYVPKEEYKEVNLIFKKIEYFAVNQSFPIISYTGIEDSIINLKYELYLPSLNKHKMEELS